MVKGGVNFTFRRIRSAPRMAPDDNAEMLRCHPLIEGGLSHICFSCSAALSCQRRRIVKDDKPNSTVSDWCLPCLGKLTATVLASNL